MRLCDFMLSVDEFEYHRARGIFRARLPLKKSKFVLYNTILNFFLFPNMEASLICFFEFQAAYASMLISQLIIKY